MKKYAVVITDADRTYVPRVILADSLTEAKKSMRVAYEAQLAEYECFGIHVHEGDTFIEETYAVVETLTEEITCFDIVEAE